MSAAIFTSARIWVAKDAYLYFDGNSKVSGWDPVPNCFSLPSVSDCPNRTPTCEAACYAHGIPSALQDEYLVNSRTIRYLLANGYWSQTVEAFATHARKYQRFRWHVSGDIFSGAYADFIVSVCLATPGTRFWIYTRSLPWADTLALAPNLTVNISADRDNYEDAMAAAKRTGFRICYLSAKGELPRRVLPDDSVIFPNYKLRMSGEWWYRLSQRERRQVCPADFYGQSEQHRCGPCTKCLKPRA